MLIPFVFSFIQNKWIQYLILSLFFVQVIGCKLDKSNQPENAQKSQTPAPVSLDIPPPPFSTLPFQKIKTENLSFKYGGKPIRFKATLFTNRVFMYNNTEVQTFVISANTEVKSDSFYFVLPVELTKLWHKITIVKSGKEFIVGYYNDKYEFNNLYKIYLGENNLNTGNIYMKYIGKSLKL